MVSPETQVTRREIVSSDAEPLILVDEHDNVIGHESKGRCHDGDGLLHRAFSMFVINDAGDVLLQQRSADKRLWPMYWSNSCCSHPRRGETLDVATARRLHEELGLSGDFEFLYKFQYHARFRDLGSEREMCSVYVGRCDDEPHVNETEIAAWRYIAPADLTAELATAPERFTPWFKLEWPRVLARLEKGL